MQKKNLYSGNASSMFVKLREISCKSHDANSWGDALNTVSLLLNTGSNCVWTGEKDCPHYKVGATFWFAINYYGVV